MNSSSEWKLEIFNHTHTGSTRLLPKKREKERERLLTHSLTIIERGGESQGQLVEKGQILRRNSTEVFRKGGKKKGGPYCTFYLEQVGRKRKK